MAVRDREGRAEPGARRDAEQVGVGKRVVEDALVGGAGDREHPADDRREDDPRCSDLPQHRLLETAQRRVNVQEGHVRERRLDDPRHADADRPDSEPNQQRADEEGAGQQPPGARDTSRPDGVRVARGRHCFRAAVAIARAKSTIRGPQREATLSSTPITR